MRVRPKKTRPVTLNQGILYLGFELRRSRDGKIAAWIKIREKALELFKERAREPTRRRQPSKVGELL